MKLILDPVVSKNIPGIQITAIVIKNLFNQKRISAVDQLLRGVCAQRKAQFKNEKELKNITEKLENTHTDNMALPEIRLLEGNIKKITRNKEIQWQNNLYAILQYLSLKNLVPIHARDMDMVEKDLVISFEKITKGKRIEDITLRRETMHLVVWLINAGNSTKEEFQQLPNEFVNIINKYCGGTSADVYYLNAENKEVDLEYESEKEIAYKEAQALKEASKEYEPKDDKDLPIEKDAAKEDFPFEKDQPATPVEREQLIPEKISKALFFSVNEWLQKSRKNTIVKRSDIVIERPHENSNGDYSTNIAMKIAKEIGKKPQKIANEIIKNLPELVFIEKTEVAGPGFINFHLTQRYFISELNQIRTKKNAYGRTYIGEGEKVLIEFSSPNIAKPLGVHHLITTILGQTLVNLYRFAGFEVVAASYPGDWGTQFGKLIYAYRNWGDKEVIDKDPISELLKLYIKFHDEAEKDKSIEDKAREEFKKLEEKDPENYKLWQWINEISQKDLERLYKKLGVKMDKYFPESKYLESCREILEEGKQKGIFKEGERGAYIVEFDEENMPPLMVQKADGTTLYATRDLASIKDRAEDKKIRKFIYIVDVAQSLHFKQIFKTAQKLGLTHDELVHVVFGRMSMPEGGMSTRKGNVVLVDQLIEEGVKRAEELIKEKSDNILPAEQKKIAEGVALGAIKYAFVSQNRETNMKFEWDKVLSFEGNSAPYLQYTLARAKSILRKASEESGAEKEEQNSENQTCLFSLATAKQAEEELDQKPFMHKTEQALLHMFPLFKEKIEMAVKEYKPHLVTGYLFELSKAFNSFYNEVHVLTAARTELKESRIRLVQGTAQILENGLNLLGITVFEKM